MKNKKVFWALMPLLVSLASCGSQTSANASSASVSSGASSAAIVSSTSVSSASGQTTSYDIGADKWNYDSSNNVYYQMGLNYCTSPVSSAYQTMGVFVPGNYFTGVKNSSGNYTCSVNAAGAQGSYTSSTAPIVLPVNTPGYAGQKAPTSYSYNSLSTFLSAGFIYVWAGMRGKDVTAGQAPWGVADLKATVRTYRYNKDKLPGSSDKMFSFGMSGGGAQSAVMGASGDSPLYTPYLTAMGAPLKDANGNTLSDAIAGSMCWCPITCLDIADEAYEWNMGQFFSSSTRSSSTWTSALSSDMAVSFAEHLNSLGLKNNGTDLKLSASSTGTYLSGTYYDYLVSVVTESLNNYLSDTYGTTTSSKASYVSGLGTWASYDSSSDQASITDLSGFIKAKKNASKPVGAFDGPAKGQGENTVMRYADATSSTSHFDAFEKKLLADNASKYSTLSGYVDYNSDFTADFSATDPVGQTVECRSNMYNPMYYLNSTFAGYKSATVAKYWRIRTGINQTDTALTTETNLALALKAYSSVSSVDFATVWGLGHTQAERTGSANANFVTWVNSCCQ
jgi:hypothetical protein